MQYLISFGAGAASDSLCGVTFIQSLLSNIFDHQTAGTQIREPGV